MNKKRLGLALQIYCVVLFMFNSSLVIAVEGIQAITIEEALQQSVVIKSDTYIDALIDPNVAEDASLEELESNATEEKDGEPEGVRAYQIDLEYKDNNDEQTSQSLGFSAYRQTSDYGDFRIDADINQITPDKNTQGKNGIVNVQNTHLALSDKLYADTQVGVINGGQNRLLGQTRYQNLPVQTYLGASSRLYFDDTEIRLTYGNLGQVVDESHFQSEGIDIAGLAYAKKINDQWLFASQAWSSKADDNFLEFAGTFKYQKGPLQSTQVQLVTNKDASGVSVETEFPMQRTHNHFGAYYLDKGLTWQSKPISDDNYGFFFQSNYQSPRFSINSGFDFQQNHLSEPDKKQQRVSVSQNYNYIYDKETSLGGGIRYVDTVDKGLKDDETTDYQTYFFVSKNYASGFSHRAQLDLSKRESRVNKEDESEKKVALDYSANFLLPMSIDMGYQINAEQVTSDKHKRQEQLSTGLSLSRSFDNGSYLSSNVQYTNVFSDNSDEGQQWNANISYDLPVNKNWHVDTYANYGLGNDDNHGDYGVGVKLSYSKQYGKPFSIKGRGKGSLLGDIKGIVFFDKNNDGIRQPSEKFAEGIQILLDGGYTVVTNVRGEFNFSLVRTGVHKVSVNFDSIPLPWEDNGSAKKVDVKLRETTRLNIPLSLILGQDADK